MLGCCRNAPLFNTSNLIQDCYRTHLRSSSDKLSSSDAPYVGFPEGLAAFLFGGSPRIRKRQDSGSPLDGFPVKKGETATHRPGGFLQVVCVKTRQRAKQKNETRAYPTLIPLTLLDRSHELCRYQLRYLE